MLHLTTKNKRLVEIIKLLQTNAEKEMKETINTAEPSYWSYRVVRFKVHHQGEVEEYCNIHEVYFNSNHEPVMYSEAAMFAQGETTEELKADLERMLKALERPIYDIDELEKLIAPPPPSTT